VTTRTAGWVYRPFRLRFLAAIVVAVFSVLALLPDRLKLDQWTPFAQIVAFRPSLAATSVLLGLLILGLGRTRPSAASLVVVGLLAVAPVLPRAFSDPKPAAGGRELSVLLFNVYDGRADPGALAKVIRDRRPDLVALPEAGQGFRARLDHALVGNGYRSWTSGTQGEPDIQGVTVLVSPSVRAANVERGTLSLFPYLTLSGGDLGRLQFVAFHTVAPVPDTIDRWRRDLGLLRRWCLSGDAIVAGDLNATYDNSVFRDNVIGCSDAADQRGQGLVGTWPSTWPRWLAVPIDHVLATEGIDAGNVEVLDIPGSDHRAVFARLLLSHHGCVLREWPCL
jgi:endonuclease/exonuclease/phosphatase (EEP) superfamily protein YafD